MKKFALGILSVFMILGGVLLSACEKKVSLSVSTEEISIYTNYEQAENYQSKEIDVSLENSSSGINIEILKGRDSISLSPVTVKNSSNYSFTIFADKSGEAEVKVSSKEDSRQSKTISVHVMTVLEEITSASEDSVDGRTNLFVTKGVEKELNVDDYFNLEPVTVNVCDIVWTFEDSDLENSQQFVRDGVLYATIENDRLLVNEDFDMSYINLRASFVNNTGIYNTVRFEVLENSTINNLTVDGTALYQNNTVATDEVTFGLVRNNSQLSSVEGTIVINTPYEITLTPVVYERLQDDSLQLLTRTEYENFLTLEIASPTVDEATNRITYNFTIDALDKFSVNKFGTFYFYLQIGYKDYNFDLISDGTTIIFDTYYSATRIETSNANGDILNNNEIDVFSNYSTGNGYRISTTILPSEVAIDNEYFYISVDLNQDSLRNLTLDGNNPVSSFVKIYYRGQELAFTNQQGSSIYTSTTILNGADVYVASGEMFDVLEDVDFRFVSCSNENANTRITMNFYRISTEQTLVVTDEADEDIPATTYMSSSAYGTGVETFVVKISDLSTTSGLSLAHDSNARFKFSELEYVSSSVNTEEGMYVIVRFTVTLNGFNFNSTTNFWFEHITGKTSTKFAIEAYVPLTFASISNADKSSSDVYKDQQSSQSYIENAGLLSIDPTKQNSSLSNLLVEAGISLPLTINYQNASLSENAITYKFLSFDNLVAAVRISEGITDDEQAIARAEELFSSGDLNAVVMNYYRYFENNNGLYFTINENRLNLTDNSFKGYVCALISGFDEEHNEIVLARFFALESFYSVRYLSSNVTTTLLYTTETLSQSDMGLSRADVTISMRPDEKVPTYSNDTSCFTFTSALDEFEVTDDGTYLKNRYYEIQNISFSSSGRYFRFRIVANSTNLQTSVRDILSITYLDQNGIERRTEIQIEIRNVNRIESVKWLNQTEDNEIYLNLTTTVNSERSFTISTSVSPSDANDGSLAYAYFAASGSRSDLSITTSLSGQIFNLNINTSKGGYGNLYLLPNDMVKIVDGVEQVLLYKYTEVDGVIVESPIYKRLSELDLYYDNLINENDEISTYFYNNDGEKIYYKDLIIKIAITIADGMSEGTAIRVYNEADLKNIDTAKYYRIMNNITLTNWTSYSQFSGMFFGKDDTVTLTFEGNSQSFVDTLLENGVIKNLIFAGRVSSAGTESSGFVVNTNRGTIDSVFVDVYYSDGNYNSSTLSATTLSTTTSSVGVMAGANYGTIKDSYSYGVTIYATNAAYVGGIAGQNLNVIQGCGVEFYSFALADGSTSSNKIESDGAIGGIAGFGGENSVIEKSYAYAYSLTETGNHAISTIFDNGNVAKGVFMAGFSFGARIDQSFAFLGDLRAPVQSNANTQNISIKNSYMSYYNNTSQQIETRLFVDATFAYINQIYHGDAQQIGNANVLQISDIPSDYNNPTTGSKWADLVARLDAEIWETVDIDSDVNFGFMYLKDTTQSAEIDVADISISDNVSPLKSLNAGNDKGILFIYSPTATISDPAEQSALTNYNTISIADLFGVTADQARSLLVTSDSKNISLSANSIRLLSKGTEEFAVTVHSKMNFTSDKTFTFVILNYLPDLVTTLNTVELEENQTILLQTGLNNSRTVMFNMNNTIYLNGTGYSTARDSFTVQYILTGNTYTETVGDVDVEKEFVTVSKNTNSLTFLGNKNHDVDGVTNVEAYITVDDVANDDDYSNAIKNIRTRNFGISVYNGATALFVENATNLIVKPSQYAVFDVTLVTDAENDNLTIGLQYGEIEIPNEISSDDFSAQFVVDSKLTLNVSWTRTTTTDGFRFRVWVRIDDEKKHLIDQIYENLTIVINATSQSANSTYLKTVGITVMTQEIEDISISTYNIESRQIRNSILYLVPADEITNTLSPSSDAIIAVTVDPAYAMMTKFSLTYSVSGDGNVGTVNISKLSHNSRYGYYVNSNSTSLIENGIEVSLSDQDRMGDGVFYFRIYISSAFETSSSLQLTLTYYNGSTPLVSGTHNLNIDYLQSANIRVNGATTYVLAKGASATVTVTVDKNQELDDLYLQNNGANISLSAYTLQEFDTYKVYTAEITASVDAKLTNDKDSGIFYVCATVRRVINNSTEIKESRATICLVDFSVDGENIKVSSSGGTSTYNGQTYDVFYSYINATDTLSFDYPFDPESYSYDQNDIDQVSAVEKIMEERARFERSNTYQDEDVGYFINYALNEETGRYEEVSLKYQLWYATDENNSTAICNDYGIIQRGTFRIDEVEGRYDDGTSYSYLTITGLRTGRQLMKLRTTITYQGIEMYYDYYFLIVVEVWSDEDTPTQIFTGQEFVDYATNSEQSDDYILMNDIVLTDYTPVNTDLIDSLDGNGYTIHINSFAYPDSTSINLALFDTVTENTTLKNVRVNIYNGGQITVNISQYTDINIAGFALENNGIIYNCEVVAYYDEQHQSSSISGETGLVVKYTMGTNTDPIGITSSMVTSLGVESLVSGFVLTNNSSITNSRVGGETFMQIIEIAGTQYLKTQSLNLFVLRGQGEVSGFVNDNSSSGYISASYADNIQIYNDMDSTASITAGFSVYNHNNIQNSYVEGKGEDILTTDDVQIYNNLSNITSIGVIGGFVYQNDALIKNSYSNIAIENSESKASLVAGFVYINNVGGEINLCYSACDITKTDISQMHFSGVDDFANSLNYGTINFSYFYNESPIDDTNQTSVTSGALSVSDVMNEDTFYGFSFASAPGAYDGIWSVSETEKLTLVSANQISFSNRYAVTNGSVTSIFYNRSLLDADTMIRVDLSYGGENNPIIIRDAYDFAMATGKAGATEISSYKEYYNDSEVFGHYRLVNNLDMSEIDQNSENENSIKLQTTKKTLTGLIDGNGFTISNISLGSSEVAENFGLFAKLDGAVIMNLDLIVDSIHNSRANIVGTLAGTAVDSRIISISLSPVASQTSVKTSILGNNVVGGVVGMLFGESKMSDINVVDIDVYSAYYLSGKNVNSNDNYTGPILRNYASNGYSISTYVSRISYAGAVAGYVDIYDSLSGDSVMFSALEGGDYDVAIIHVSDSVNIYGEVAGGLFGYVGSSTLIFDATLELDADMNLSNPSYIISKNLYAGGLVGENYGGLFAISASYSDALQDTIETSENSYYTGEITAEKGQQSIFSYTMNDEGYSSNINDPLFIGGIVGYMGGGYIYIGYNKLNVISHSASTLAVGGIIGLAGYEDSLYDLSFIDSMPKINILLNDVYASGDVYVDTVSENGVSAGIIGALERTDTENVSIVAMKNVLAVNYYSYNGSQLVGDNVESETTGVSDRHFILVGNVINSDDNTIFEDNFDSRLYLIDSEDYYLDVSKSYAYDGAFHQSDTVGGYTQVLLNNSVSLSLRPYGFKTAWDNGDSSRLYDAILSVESIGDQSMSTMSSAYAQMYNYFLANNWSEQYWAHTEEDLFPHIQLLPLPNVIFWDQYNTDEVLRAMENGSITVVVRGKVDEDVDEYKDIDLTKPYTDSNGGVHTFSAISGFYGNLISYYDYTNSSTEGFITEVVYGDGGKVVGGYAGTAVSGADKVGIIIDTPFFENLTNGANVEGINFYLCANEDDVINYSLVQAEVGNNSETGNAVFRDVNIVLNSDVKLSTSSENLGTETSYMAGLITRIAHESSFINITFTIRNNSSLTFEHSSSDGSSGGEYDVYMGLIAGYVEQTTTFTQINIQGVYLVNQDDTGVETDDKTDITFNVDDNVGVSKINVFAGLYAGKVTKGSGRARISIGLSNVGNVNLKFSASTTTDSPNTDMFIGGFVGEIVSVDNVTLMSGSSDSLVSGLDINQCSSVNSLYAGLAFGRIENSYLTISNVGYEGAALSGGIYQVGDDIYNRQTNIGGIAATVNSATVIQSFSVNLNVGKKEDIDSEAEDYIVDERTEETVFDQNLYDYSDSALKDSAFSTTGVYGDNIGGYFGFVSGANIILTGNNNITGNVNVSVGDTAGMDLTDSVSEINIGGFIGQTQGSVTINAIINNSMNVSIFDPNLNIDKDPTSPEIRTNVGGLIGKMTNVIGDVGNASSSVINSNQTYFYFTGNVLSSVKNFVFGGAIGYVEREDFVNTDKAISISGIVFGGAVKIYGQVIDGKYYLPQDIIVGGVVGEYALSGELEDLEQEMDRVYTISGCFTYGDVFVNYYPGSLEGYNTRLDTYNFGGIVGVGSHIAIENCCTLMTSFNDRIAYNESGESDDEDTSNTNAIVGRNSNAVQYTDNKYNSSVCMAYQEENGNQDIGYGEIDVYSGYTSRYDATVEEGGSLAEELTPNENIFDVVNQYLQNVGLNYESYEVGHKLNPYSWRGTDSGKHIKENETDTENSIEIKGSLHGISWVTIIENFETSESIANNLKNFAIIGNGHIVTRTDVDEAYTSSAGSGDLLGYGALVNNLGESYREGDLSLNFNIIAGLVMNLEIISTDVNGAGSTAFGGVAGTMNGNSFIYGMGVKGELSVGGSSSQLQLGGIAGYMYSGSINECYVDADITYRASEGGRLSGIANMGDRNTTIKSTYSSGLLETYVDIDGIYTFANSLHAAGATTSADILDTYSVSQVKINNSLGGEINTKSSFVSGVNAIGNVINGSNEVLDNKYDEASETIENLAVNYSGYYQDDAYVNGLSQDSLIIGNSDETEHTWYFNRYVNYGYASHGFGYMKNVTTYTYTEPTEEASDDYEPISYIDVLTEGNNYNEHEWYLGVLNQGKFKQLYETVEASEENEIYNSEVGNNYKFVLRYSFEVGDDIGKDLGVSGRDLVIDGQNNTLKISSTESGLFDTYVGTIRNLRVENTNLETKQQYAGILANVLKGEIENVTVNGAMTPTGSKIIGGVVGVLEGMATNVDAVVNITVNESSIVGGVVGYLTSYSETTTGEDGETTTTQGEVSLASNNGMIIQTVSSDILSLDEEEIQVTPRNYDGTTIANKELNGIAGGIVGYADGGSSISWSYNTNAVLSQFTNNAGANVVAGGIVGYIAGGTEIDGQSKIEECYNTGLVGAGNTNTDGKCSFAGGIVGYGAKVIVSDCVNDGAVQAISQAVEENKKYKIETELQKTNAAGEEYGKEVEEEFKANPMPLVYKIIMTYNLGQSREVFAYGIGYLADGGMEGCSSSTNNIKNDGNLGEIKSKQELKFNRIEILDGDGAEVKIGPNEGYSSGGNYQGKFIVEGKEEIDNDGNISYEGEANVYVNGYDSYGYASRVYMKDTITRRYVGGLDDNETGKYLNEIEKALSIFVVNEGGTLIPGIGGRYYWGIAKTDSSTDEDEPYGIEDQLSAEKAGFDGKNNGVYQVEDEDIMKKITDAMTSDSVLGMDASTTYSESVSFTRYDEYLSEHVVGWLKSKPVDNTSGDIDSRVTVESGIQEIQSQKGSEEEMRIFTINGEETAMVFNSSHFKTVYVPYSFEFTDYIELEDIIDLSTITKNDFVVDSVIIGGKTEEYQFKTVKYSVLDEYVDESGTVHEGKFLKVDFCFYFNEYDLDFGDAESLSGNVAYHVVMKTIPQEITLGKNNVSYSGGEITIVLEDDEASSGLTEEIVTSINAGETGYSLSVTISSASEPPEETELSGFELSYSDGKAQISFDGTSTDAAALHGQTLSISVSVPTESVAYGNGYVETSSDVVGIGLADPTETLTFVGYESNAISLPNEYETVEIEVENEAGETVSYVTEIRVSLDDIISEYGQRFAFGKEGVFAVRYEGGSFEVEDEIDNVILGIDGNNLLIQKAITIGDAEYLINEYTDPEYLIGLEDDLEDVYGENIKSSTIYYDLSAENIEADGSLELGNVEKSVGSFTLIYDKSASDKGNFKTDGTYGGSDFNSESGNGILSSSETHFGMQFYTKKVTYTYTFSNGKISYSGSTGIGTGVGVEITLQSGTENKATILSYLKEGKVIDLPNLSDISSVSIMSHTVDERGLTEDIEGVEIVGYSVYSGVLQGSISIGSVTYEVSSGSELCPICSSASCSYYMTTGEFDYDTETRLRYEYKIYDCGATSVAYEQIRQIRLSGDDESEYTEEVESGIMYAASTDDMLAGEIKVFELNDEGSWIEQEESTSDIDISVFNSHNFDGKTINADLVVSYFDANDIFFAKTPRNRVEYVSMEYGEEGLTTGYNDTISLYYGQESSQYIGAGGEYRGENDTSWTSANRISAETYEMQTYYYRTETTKNSSDNPVEVKNVEDEDILDISYIVFGEDIYLDQWGYIDPNDKSIIGNDFNLTFMNNENSTSLFDINSALIRDLNVIGIVSGSEINSSAGNSMFIRSNAAGVYITGVSLYGNFRNISPDAGDVQTAILSNSSSNITNLESYVSMTGLDSESEQDVDATLMDSLAGVNAKDGYTSHNILIAGNGGNGEDGADGANIGSAGKVGASGGAGGDISLNANTFEGFCKVGLGGIGGNGGNGANGGFADYASGVYGGGDGGAAGNLVYGYDGDSYPNWGYHHRVYDGSINIETDREINQNDREGTPCGGNGGIGGFGRIMGKTLSYDFYQLLPSARSGESNSSSPKVGWDDSRRSRPGNRNYGIEAKRWSFTGEAKLNDFYSNHSTAFGLVNTERFMSEVSWGRTNHHEDWTGDGDDTKSFYVEVSKIEKNKGYYYYPEKIYIVACVKNEHDSIYGDFYKLAWTSGEGFNSSGNCDTTGSQYTG